MSSEIGLPRATFAKLSPHPYLLANLDPSDGKPSRSNGRSQNEVRIPTVNISSLSHAHGSAVVRTGDTTVICGVRAETLLSSNIPNFRNTNRETELRDYDLLVPNIELATGSSPQFLPGGPPTSLAQTLSTRIFSLLHSSKIIDPAELRICDRRMADEVTHSQDEQMEDAADDEQLDAEGSSEDVIAAYWVLYIDIFFISFDGNPFDAAWAATVAALRDTKIPVARLDNDREIVVCARKTPPRPLNIKTMPIACTAVIFTGKDTDRPTDGKFWLLADPDMLEESLCDETITVVVDCSQEGDTKLLSVSRHGGTAITPELLTSHEFMGWARTRWAQFAHAIKG